ncbi:cytochrome c oxidase subunit 7A, mitochondrial-like [Penaeus monodon]|uniref:cytochrome c oxidase subunit 7A, mitochondrial-like n=1 Tax=Penaeus monodon TaxID=6687 RepID=UPI0018A7D782|nr:cytochrome c oxidase subunit 7A, mitochondrial-like [Penaeus monodon]
MMTKPQRQTPFLINSTKDSHRSLCTLRRPSWTQRETGTARINVARAAVRTFTSSSARRAATDVHPGYGQIRGTMNKFQVDNGMPIHLKGGVFDNLLFVSTCVLNAVGLSMTLGFIYDMSFPKKA